jgi:hypothetical protein
MVSIEIAITVAGIMLSNVLLLLNKIKVFKGCCCEFETKEDDRVRTAKKWKDKLFPKTKNKNILDRQTSLAISNVSTSPKHERRKHFRRRSLDKSSSSSSLDKSYRKYRENSPRNSTGNRNTRRREIRVVKNTVVTKILSDDIVAIKTEHSITEEQKTTEWTFLFKNDNSPTNDRNERKMSIEIKKSKSMDDIIETKNIMYYVDMLNNVQIMGSYSDDEQSNSVCIDENGSPIIHITEIQII